MNRFPANEHNIKSLGIDFDNLTHSEIIDAIYKIDGAVYDSETNLIYTDIMDCFDDKKYFNLLREVGVPTLSDFLKQLSSIKDEKIRADLHYHGFFKILDAEYNAKFKILDLMLKNKELDEFGKENIISSSKVVVQGNFEHLKTSYENLVYDPLFHPDNEHILLEKELNDKIKEHLEQSRLNDIFYIDDFDDDFKDWQKQQNIVIEKSFRQLVKKLNQEKTFFFGCSFDNYKHNYEKRLNAFLENYYDAEESDFIKSEEEFLENILHDLKNPEGAHDGYAVSGYDNFSKAYSIIKSLGFDQYIFSNNKKTTFLNERKTNMCSNDLDIDNPISEEKPIQDENLTKFVPEENNFLRSTIHEYLEELKIEINGNGYDILVNALFEYFSNGSFPTLTTKINFKKINKKRVGWALKELYKSERTSNLEIEYFRFAKDNINLFANEIIVEKDFKKSKFYKAFTTNPAK